MSHSLPRYFADTAEGRRSSSAKPAEKPGAQVVPGRLDRLRTLPRQEGMASFFYREVAFNADAVKVMPGEYFVHDEDIAITTTLGSCIAACLWDKQARVGGMNHFMLPGGSGSGSEAGRYGSYAMEILINALLKRGATRKTMEAKVFGGAALIQGPGSLHVGQRNTEFVLQYLRTEDITLVSKDVLGENPRKVCFFPASGRVMVRRLPPTHRDKVLALERDARSRTAPASGGTIDLF